MIEICAYHILKPLVFSEAGHIPVGAYILPVVKTFLKGFFEIIVGSVCQ